MEEGIGTCVPGLAHELENETEKGTQRGYAMGEKSTELHDDTEHTHPERHPCWR